LGADGVPHAARTGPVHAGVDQTRVEN